MKLRTMFHFIVAIGVISATLSGGEKGKAHGKVEPYSMSVTALKGSETTDVCVTFTTDDAEFPVPDLIKKLKIKVRNQDGDAVYVRNYFDVPISGNQACIAVPDLYPLMSVEIHALLKKSKKVDTEVLRASTTVLFRPDLTIEQVNAPDQTGPDVPFSVSVLVQENKFQTSATAVVSLYDGETQLATVPGVLVNAGGQSSVIFSGIVLSETGTHDLTARISDSVPGEYDVTNNDYQFSILVSSSVQEVPFTLSYYYEKNVNVHRRETFCGVVMMEVTEVGDRGEWSYSTTMPFEVASPIDSIRWQAISGGVSLTSGISTVLTPDISNSSSDFYTRTFTDADESVLQLDVTVDKVLHETRLQLHKVAGDYVYVVYFGGPTDVIEQHSSQMNLVDSLEVRILFADDGELAGGGASILIAPYETVNEDHSFIVDVGGGCLLEVVDIMQFEVSTNDTSGTTNPSLLPSASSSKSVLLSASSMPEQSDIVQSYPNPFNPTATVQFTVEQSGPAILRIYDMLGKEVAELFHGEAEEGKMYRFTFNASDVASGMYYARLEAGGRQYTRKMILMK